ncbi:MAG: hypothetical protein QF412_07580, partial [Planctomycetota bacterium]|nr:hypothetical protein [Planctomycetota bacterium]
EHWDEERLHAELDRIEDLVADHLHGSQSDFKNAVSRMRNFIETRRDVLGKELASWPIEFPAAPREPIHFKKIGTVTATFSTQWAERSPAEPLEAGSADLTLVLDGKHVALTRVGVSAAPGRLPSSRERRPPTIVFSAERESDGKVLTISASLSSADFKPSGKKGKSVSGLFMEGQLGFFSSGGIKTISGTARLDAAGMMPGDPVKGSVELVLMKMGSGLFGRNRRR